MGVQQSTAAWSALCGEGENNAACAADVAAFLDERELQHRPNTPALRYDYAPCQKHKIWALQRLRRPPYAPEVAERFRKRILDVPCGLTADVKEGHVDPFLYGTEIIAEADARGNPQPDWATTTAEPRALFVWCYNGRFPVNTVHFLGSRSRQLETLGFRGNIGGILPATTVMWEFVHDLVVWFRSREMRVFRMDRLRHVDRFRRLTTLHIGVDECPVALVYHLLWTCAETIENVHLPARIDGDPSGMTIPDHWPPALGARLRSVTLDTRSDPRLQDLFGLRGGVRFGGMHAWVTPAAALADAPVVGVVRLFSVFDLGEPEASPVMGHTADLTPRQRGVRIADSIWDTAEDLLSMAALFLHDLGTTIVALDRADDASVILDSNMPMEVYPVVMHTQTGLPAKWVWVETNGWHTLLLAVCAWPGTKPGSEHRGLLLLHRPSAAATIEPPAIVAFHQYDGAPPNADAWYAGGVVTEANEFPFSNIQAFETAMATILETPSVQDIAVAHGFPTDTQSYQYGIPRNRNQPPSTDPADHPELNVVWHGELDFAWCRDRGAPGA